MRAEADRLRRLVEDLLVLSRAELGRIEVVPEPVLVQRLIPRSVAAEESRWPATRFRFELQQPLPPVVGDETYLDQALRNRVGNAAKYSPAGRCGSSMRVPASRPRNPSGSSSSFTVRQAPRKPRPGLASVSSSRSSLWKRWVVRSGPLHDPEGAPSSACASTPTPRIFRRTYGGSAAGEVEDLVEMGESRTPRPERSAEDHYERVRCFVVNLPGCHRQHPSRSIHVPLRALRPAT